MTRTRGKILTYVVVALLIGGIFTATAVNNVRGNGDCDRQRDGSCLEE